MIRDVTMHLSRLREIRQTCANTSRNKTQNSAPLSSRTQNPRIRRAIPQKSSYKNNAVVIIAPLFPSWNTGNALACLNPRDIRTAVLNVCAGVDAHVGVCKDSEEMADDANVKLFVYIPVLNGGGYAGLL